MCEKFANENIPVTQENVLEGSNELHLTLFQPSQINYRIDELHKLRFAKAFPKKFDYSHSYQKLYQLIRKSKSQRIN